MSGIEPGRGCADQSIVRQLILLTLFSVSFSSYAGEFSGADAFRNALPEFNQLQNQKTCAKVQMAPAQCPKIIEELSRDDTKQQLAVVMILPSGAKNCREQFLKTEGADGQNIKYDHTPPTFLQNEFEHGNFSALGSYTHEVARACLRSPVTNNNFDLSKFYYYAARLNETSARIAQEQVRIHQMLGMPDSCPNKYLLTIASDICEKTQACDQKMSLQQTAQQAEEDEPVYLRTKGLLEKLSDRCDENSTCKKNKDALTTKLAGLLSRNPWFLSPHFSWSRRTDAMESRLKKYLIVAEKNLASQQSKIEKAAMCLHVRENSKCEMEEMRETLSLTQNLPQNKNRKGLEAVQDNYSNMQSCLEEKTLARNRKAAFIKQVGFDVGLGLVMLPLGAAVAAGQATRMALIRLAPLLATDIAVNAISSQDSWKAMVSACFKPAEVEFSYAKADRDQICNNAVSALSPGKFNEASCLVNATLSATGILPVAVTGAQMLSTVAKRAAVNETSRVTASVKNATHTELRETATATTPARRAEDLAADREKRTGTLQNYKCVTCPADKGVEFVSMPNVPPSLLVRETVKVDGSKFLTYKYPEKLPSGEWVVITKEFHVDDVTGGIDARDAMGRQLFEMIAHEKSGKAHYAFFDVGSLGFVNKTFKAGEAAGDRYLNGVAQKILELGEGKITLARTGGDEFGLIIDEADPVKAKALIERIQSEIRKDLKGDARQVFLAEKLETKAKFKEALKNYEREKYSDLNSTQKTEITERYSQFKKTQQPDVSIGLTQIGTEDDLLTLSGRSEPLAQKMKISSAVENGRDPSKYGSKQQPKVRPNPIYLAPVENPVPSASWQSGVTRFSSAPPTVTLRSMVTDPVEELARFSDMSLVRFEDELGRSSLKTERFVVDPATGKKIPVISDISTSGATGLLLGSHPESIKLIASTLKASKDSILVMPKLKSLKYFNYFTNGTKAGDDVLEAVADVMRAHSRRSDLNFKMNGADFMMATKNRPPAELESLYKDMGEQLAKHPKVVAVMQRQAQVLKDELAAAVRSQEEALIKGIKQRQEDLKNFKLDLQFQSLDQSEVTSSSSLKDIQNKFDAKFPK